MYGDNTAITEDSPFEAPAMVSWKEPIERRVLGAKGAARGVGAPSPSVAYGDGGGRGARASSWVLLETRKAT